MAPRAFGRLTKVRTPLACFAPLCLRACVGFTHSVCSSASFPLPCAFSPDPLSCPLCAFTFCVFTLCAFTLGCLHLVSCVCLCLPSVSVQVPWFEDALAGEKVSNTTHPPRPRVARSKLRSRHARNTRGRGGAPASSSPSPHHEGGGDGGLDPYLVMLVPTAGVQMAGGGVVGDEATHAGATAAGSEAAASGWLEIGCKMTNVKHFNSIQL